MIVSDCPFAVRSKKGHWAKGKSWLKQSYAFNPVPDAPSYPLLCTEKNFILNSIIFFKGRKDDA